MRSKIDRNCLSKPEMTDTVPVISKRLMQGAVLGIMLTKSV